jgi:hypothetical protein
MDASGRPEGQLTPPAEAHHALHPHQVLGPILLAVALSACAVSGPSVGVLPGQGTTFEQFQGDDTACRAIAAGPDPEKSQARYDMTYIQCMYAKGHRVPVPGGSSYTSESSSPSATSPARDIPTPPPGTPPPPPPPVGTTR